MRLLTIRRVNKTVHCLWRKGIVFFLMSEWAPNKYNSNRLSLIFSIQKAWLAKMFSSMNTWDQKQILKQPKLKQHRFYNIRNLIHGRYLQLIPVRACYFKARNKLINHKNSNRRLSRQRKQSRNHQTFTKNNWIGLKRRKRLFRRNKRRKNWKKLKGLLLNHRYRPDQSQENPAKIVRVPQRRTWAPLRISNLKSRKRSRLNRTRAKNL